MRIFIPLIAATLLLGCQVKNIKKAESYNVFNLKSESGDILYNNFPNNLYFDSWPIDELDVKYIPIENCKIKLNDYYLTVTPTNNPKNVIIGVELPNGKIKKFIYKISELPEPNLYYNIDTEVEKQRLNNEIDKSNISNLFYFEALTEIGKLSWVTYEIIDFDIMIIRKKTVIYDKKNIGSEMNDGNKHFLENLNSKDILIFRNIRVKQTLKEEIITFNERSITIK